MPGPTVFSDSLSGVNDVDRRLRRVRLDREVPHNGVTVEVQYYRKLFIYKTNDDTISQADENKKSHRW